MATTADLTKAKSQLISILQASRTAYASTVDGSKRQFASDTEIADALLSSDGEYCTAIIQTPGHPFSNTFKLTSSALVSGDNLPTFMGRILNVTHCATSGGTYTQSRVAGSREIVLDMIDNLALFSSSTTHVKDYYYIEDDTIYMVDAYSKVVYTDYVRTAVLQAPESYSAGVVAGAAERLLKDGGDAQMSQWYSNLHRNYLAEVRGGAKMLPEINNYS